MYHCDLSAFKINNMNSSLGLKKEMYFASSLGDLQEWISEKYGLTKESYYILRNGRKISACEGDCYEGMLHIIPRTFGGKGGFGSMLRAIGAQIEKTTNREACRDLSGRRLRDINEEQRLKNWISQQADREREAAERKKKKLERLCQEPKHDFKDDKYDENRSTMTEHMSSSIDQGFKASTSATSTSGNGNLKRKQDVDHSKKAPAKKKKNLWIDADESDSSSSDSGCTIKEEDAVVCVSNKS